MSLQNFIFLARLEVAEKFVVGWGGGVGWWSRPSLAFSFSQAEQLTWMQFLTKLLFLSQHLSLSGVGWCLVLLSFGIKCCLLFSSFWYVVLSGVLCCMVFSVVWYLV